MINSENGMNEGTSSHVLIIFIYQGHRIEHRVRQEKVYVFGGLWNKQYEVTGQN